MKTTRLLVSTCAAAVALGASTPALAGDLTGFVFDATDTIALQSAQVRVVELDRVVATERDGSYLIAGLPEGSYTVEVRYVGAETVTQTVDVTETGMTRLDVAMGGADAEILVIGQAANQASALSRKREADGVSDVLTRDAIGQFPDQNVAESLRRLPGINVLNDQGEGRFVSVRGLDPELNATSLNGVRLPAPESDVRSVALDVISSDTIESIEVKKSLTPDMDADTIGASLEIKTTSAFDRKKDLYTARIEGSYNDYSGKVTPKGSFDFATRVGDDFGIAGGVSYYEREFETDNVESDFWDSAGGVAFSPETEYRDYDVKRKRINANLGFDFRLSDTTTAYIKGNWAQFDDHEYRNRTTFIFDEDPASGDADSAFFTDADGRIEIRRDVKDRFERQRIRSVVLGSDTDTGEWKFDWAASWAKSSEYENGSLDPTRFRARFDGDGVDINMDYSDPRVPLYSITSGASLVNDPSEYGFNRIEKTDLSNSVDEEYALKGDVGRTFFTDSGEFTVQAGAKARWRDKSYDFNLLYYGDFDGDYTLADVLGEQTYRLTDMGPVSNRTGPRDFYLANMADFEIDPIETAYGSAVEDYSISEDIVAGYLLGRWDSATLRVIGGVRYEHTSNEIFGNETLLVEEDGTLPGGGTATEDTVIVTPVMYDKNYEHWLPSLNLRWEAQPDLIVRLAGYRSIVRPKLSKLAPRFAIEQNDEDEREGEFGNPALKPYEAWNFDASFEYYMSSNGALTAGLFYKDIKNFVVDVVDDDGGVFNGIAYDEATIPLNGDSGEIFGIEVSYSQAFTMLPDPLDGLLLQVNYTYTDATGSVYSDINDPVVRDINLPSASKNTLNVVIGYEKGPIELRAAGTYRDKFLEELGGDAESDRYADDHFQVDLSAKFKVTENVRLFAEWVNVNNAKYFAYQNFDGSRRLLQYEEYGSTVKFGAKVNF